MRIGILADIHDAVGPLRSALASLRQADVDQFVSLGDAFDSCQPGEPGVEVARLLQEAGAVGVWGNHDVGLSHEVSAQVRELADPALLDFAARLRPQLELHGCRFSHVEPWRNPCLVEDLGAFDGVPDSDAHADRSFEAVPEQVIFMGHFHLWLAMRRPGGRVPWDGASPIRLAPPNRHLVVVGAVVYGWCAIFDTESSVLTPIRCSGQHPVRADGRRAREGRRR